MQSVAALVSICARAGLFTVMAGRPDASWLFFCFEEADSGMVMLIPVVRGEWKSPVQARGRIENPLRDQGEHTLSQRRSVNAARL